MFKKSSPVPRLKKPRSPLRGSIKKNFSQQQTSAVSKNTPLSNISSTDAILNSINNPNAKNQEPVFF
jgi:hypothetical protein